MRRKFMRFANEFLFESFLNKKRQRLTIIGRERAGGRAIVPYHIISNHNIIH